MQEGNQPLLPSNSSRPFRTGRFRRRTQDSCAAYHTSARQTLAAQGVGGRTGYDQSIGSSRRMGWWGGWTRHPRARYVGGAGCAL